MRMRPVAFVVSVAALLVSTAIPSPALAQGQAGQPHRRLLNQRVNRALGGQWWTDATVSQGLGLSAEQVERLNGMGERFQELGQTYRKEYLQSYRALIEALSDYTTKDEVIYERRQAFEKIRAQLVAMTIDELLEERAILSQEQWAKLPQVAPQALRLGRATYRGGGVVKGQTGSSQPDE